MFPAIIVRFAFCSELYPSPQKTRLNFPIRIGTSWFGVVYFYFVPVFNYIDKYTYDMRSIWIRSNHHSRNHVRIPLNCKLHLPPKRTSSRMQGNRVESGWCLCRSDPDKEGKVLFVGARDATTLFNFGWNYAFESDGRLPFGEPNSKVRGPTSHRQIVILDTILLYRLQYSNQTRCCRVGWKSESCRYHNNTTSLYP